MAAMVPGTTENHKHVARYNALYAERTNLDNTYELIARYAVPGKGRFFETESDQEQSIEWRNRDLYDNTAVVCVETMAASIHGNLTNPASDWFDFRFQQDRLNKDKAAAQWLENCKNITWHAIQESNFNQEVMEFYVDDVAFGTGVMTEEYDENVGLKFKTFMCRGVYYIEDFDGAIIAMYQKQQYTAVALIDKFGDNCPDDIMEKAKKPNQTEKISVIHCIYKRDYMEGDENIDFNKKVAPEKRPFQERFILEKDAVQLNSEPLGHYEMPAYIARWKRTAGSKFGYSQTMVAMPDILSLNQLTEYILKATEKKIDPPLLVKRKGTFGNLSMEAGATNVVSDMNNIRPFDGGADISVGELERQQLINSIRQTFFIDKLELKESPAMTATEVNVRYEMMMRLLGPALTRLQTDFLQPMLLRTFNLLYRAGKLPEMPDAVKDNDGTFEIEYLGPMARAQRMSDVQAMGAFMSQLIPMAEIKPEVLDRIDMDEAAKLAANRMGVPPVVIRSDQEVKQIRTGRAQAQNAQQQAAMGASAAAAAKDVSVARLNDAKSTGAV